MWKKFVGIILFAILSFVPVLCYADTTPESDVVPVSKVSVHFWIVGNDGGWVKAQGDWTATSGGSKKMSFYNTPARNNSPKVVGDATYTFAGYWTDDFGNTYSADDGARLQGTDFINLFSGVQGPTAELNLYAGYTIERDYTFYGNWIDSVAHGGGSESHIVNFNTGYVHTFAVPADIPERYQFLYWSNEAYGNRVAGETFEVAPGSLSGDLTVDYVATYEYTPQTAVKVVYKSDGKVIKETELSTESIDVVENAPSVPNLLYWTLDGQPCLTAQATPDEPVPFITTELADKTPAVKTVEVEAVINTTPVVPTPGGTDPVVPEVKPVVPENPVPETIEPTPAAPSVIVVPAQETVQPVAPVVEESSSVVVADNTTEPINVEKKTEKIADNENPLAQKDDSHWALLNLIFMLGNLLVLLIIPRKEQEGEETKKKYRTNILGVILAIAAVLTFILTQNIYTTMVIVDQWTILMGIFVAGGILSKVFGYKKVKD